MAEFKGEKTIKYSYRLKKWKIVSLFIISIVLSGCIQLKHPTLKHPEMEELLKAETEFLNGIYDKAYLIFDSVLKKSKDNKSKLRASYGIACIKLVRSKKMNEAKENIGKIDSFFLKTEYRNILNPALFSHGIIKALKLSEMEIQNNIRRANLYKNSLKKRKLSIEKLKEHIKTLKYQISELQNIDRKLQEIQEKRNKN